MATHRLLSAALLLALLVASCQPARGEVTSVLPGQLPDGDLVQSNNNDVGAAREDASSLAGGVAAEDALLADVCGGPFSENATDARWADVEPTRVVSRATAGGFSCCYWCLIAPSCVYFQVNPEGGCELISGDAPVPSLTRGGAAARGYSAGYLYKRSFEARALAPMQLPGDRVRPLAVTTLNFPIAEQCAGQCETQCGCTWWSMSYSTADCWLFAESTVGPEPLVPDENYVSGLLLGESLNLTLLSFTEFPDELELLPAAEGEGTIGDEGELERRVTQTQLLYNANGTAAEVDSVPYSFPVVWRTNETLYGGLSGYVPLDVAALTDAFEPAASNGTELTGLPLYAGDWQSGVRGAVPLPEPELAAPHGTTRLALNLTVASVRVPWEVRFLAAACRDRALDFGGGKQGGKKQDKAATPADTLALLERGGFTGSVVEGEDEGESGASGLVVALQGGAVYSGIPLELGGVTREVVAQSAACNPRAYVEFLGADLYGECGKPAGSWQDCCALCGKDRRCQTWTYDQAARGTCGEGACLLRAGSTNSVSVPGVVSGLKAEWSV